MPTLNPGQANLVRGTFSGDCTLEYDLIRNQQKFPAIRQMLERVDQRQLTTLLTSGAVTPYGIDITKPTKFGKVKEGQAIGDTALRFNVMGRIQKASTILAQVGSSGADGTFQLLMQDNYIYKGQVCVFYGNRYSAMALSALSVNCTV